MFEKFGWCRSLILETLRDKTLIFLMRIMNDGGVKKQTRQFEKECIILLGWISIHFHIINYHDFQFLALESTVVSLNNRNHCFRNLGRADEHDNK